MSLSGYVTLGLFIFIFYKVIKILKAFIERKRIQKMSRLYYKLSFGFENEKLKYCAVSSHVLYKPEDIVDYPEKIILHFEDIAECQAAYDFITSREFEFKKLDEAVKKRVIKST